MDEDEVVDVTEAVIVAVFLFRFYFLSQINKDKSKGVEIIFVSKGSNPVSDEETKGFG